MDLNFDEKTMLNLYRLLYGEAYDLDDNESINLGQLSLIRKRKMQDAIYFLQQFNCGGKKRFFIFDFHIPYSLSLDMDLDNLEKKKEVVQQFNLEFGNLQLFLHKVSSILSFHFLAFIFSCSSESIILAEAS